MAKAQNKKQKTYVLGMFPYPSGDGLHVGHVRIYTAVDVMSRFFRMQGHDVLDPIGWDAFGLPAENAAIKNKMNPQDIVPKNYNNFRKQMKNLSFAFDWEHEFATTDPTYYGLTQWIFLELYKKGLVYREHVPINWCPKCKTGLANEEVLPDGTHERCGTLTGKKLLPQWVMKITDYADRLLSDLGDKTRPESELDWPRGILEMQRNWIGKKEGIEITYPIENSPETVTCFTTRPDTNFGATFVVIAPEHPLAQKSSVPEVQKYITQSLAKSEVERQVEGKTKTGAFTGLYAINHLTGRKMPIWVSDFVLAQFGTGAVVGVPGHDERDFQFATTFDIPIVRVVTGKDGDASDITSLEQVQEEEGTMVNSDFLNGMEIHAATKKIMDYMEEKGWGERVANYHLRDWVFSRQRYWGEPIPLVYCEKCGDSNGVVPLSEKDLPLELPYLESYEPTDTGESPLARVTEWVTTTCPHCGGPAKRETDTMPNWAGSCWYHLAFPFWNNQSNSENSDNQKTQKIGAPEKSENQQGTKSILERYRQSGSKTPYSDFWREVARPAIDSKLPVDWYLGGAEHAVLHLLYARFWMKVLYDLGHIGFTEPYLRLRSVGIVLAEDGRKMSKSWGNVINPDDVVREFGSDAVRLYEMFMGPWDQSIAWESRALVGMKRFVERIESVYAMSNKFGEQTSPVLAAQLAKLITHVESGVVEQKFNTCIAQIMEFLNSWRNSDLVLSREHAQYFAQILSSFAPIAAQKVWEMAGGKGEVAASQWPRLDAAAVEAPVTVAVQVNGKLRGAIVLSSAEARDQQIVEKAALADEKVAKWVTGTPKKIIFVPGKIMNIVV